LFFIPKHRYNAATRKELGFKISLFIIFCSCLIANDTLYAATENSNVTNDNLISEGSFEKTQFPVTITSDIVVLTEESSSLVKDVTLTVIGDRAYREGDIFVGYVNEHNELIQPNTSSLKGQVGDAKTVVVSNASLRWSNGIVPFVISTLFDNQITTENAIQDAMDAISSNSGVRFVPRTGHNDYIEFIPASDLCSSHVGKKGGKQYLRLASYCQSGDETSIGTIIHELLHALGYHHTHTRSDRDSYISINTSNIRPAYLYNFDKFASNDSSVNNFGPYDLISIMHYSRFTASTSFVFDTSESMLDVIGSPSASTGGSVLSSNDIASLKEIYGAMEPPYLSGMSLYCRGDTQLSWNSINAASYYVIEYSQYGNWYQLLTTSSTSKFVRGNNSRYLRVLACDANADCSLGSNEFYAPYYSICQ
jgi:hypothetical protein